MNQCLCLNKNNCNNLELLQKDFVNFIFSEEGERSTELRMKCGKYYSTVARKSKNYM